MPASFLTARGAVYIHDVEPKGKTYKLSPNLFAAGKHNEKSDTHDSTAVIFTGYTMKENEIVAKAACLNDNRVLYTFGKGFGDITISGEALMGPAYIHSNFEGVLQTYYELNRASVGGGGAHVSLSSTQGGGMALPFFLVGMSVNGYDPTLEILSFSLIGVLSK